MEVNPPGSGMRLAACDADTGGTAESERPGARLYAGVGGVTMAMSGFWGKGVCALSYAGSGNTGCSMS